MVLMSNGVQSLVVADARRSGAGGVMVSVPWLTAAAAVLCCLTLNAVFEPFRASSDFAQYLSVAGNFLNGKGLSTSLIYFEQHYAIGGVPVAQTVWPPGYPILIAALGSTGVSLEYSGFLVSLLSFVMTAFVIRRVMRIAGRSRLVADLAGLSWLLLFYGWSLILIGTSETPFILFTVLALWCALEAGRRPAGEYGWLLAAGVCAAAGVAIRYPGVFFVLSLAAYYFFAWMRAGTAAGFLRLACVSLPPGFMAIGLIARNYALSGTIGGAAVIDSERGFADLLRNAYWATGKIAGFESGPVPGWIVLLGLAFLVVLSLAAVLKRVSRATTFGSSALLESQAFHCIIYITVTLLALSLLGVTRTTGYLNERYLFPLVPFAIILFATVLSARSASGETVEIRGDARLSIGLVLAGLLLTAGQVNVLVAERNWHSGLTRNEVMLAALDSRLDSGRLFDYLRREISDDSPLLAPEGQALGFLLERPVVGLTSSLYSDRPWTEDRVRALVQQYGIGHVIFFPGLFDASGKADANRIFFADLDNGFEPSWLSEYPVAGDVRLFRVRQDML